MDSHTTLVSPQRPPYLTHTNILIVLLVFLTFSLLGLGFAFLSPLSSAPQSKAASADALTSPRTTLHPFSSSAFSSTPPFSRPAPHSTAPISILVISTPADNFPAVTQHRYRTEKHTWLKQYTSASHGDADEIQCVLMECNTTSTAPARTGHVWVQHYPCKESFQPGIFQKTLLALRDQLMQPSPPEIFVRTNLSTFVLLRRLRQHVAPYRHSSAPYYGGVYCRNDFWVGGWGIVLNRAAAKRLVEEGFRPERFRTMRADDVLIGQVMQDKGVRCDPKACILGYTWDAAHDTAYHLQRLREKSHVVFVRLKMEDGWEEGKYRHAVEALLQFEKEQPDGATCL